MPKRIALFGIASAVLPPLAIHPFSCCDHTDVRRPVSVVRFATTEAINLQLCTYVLVGDSISVRSYSWFVLQGPKPKNTKWLDLQFFKILGTSNKDT
jgi:hypothetical protein